MGIKEKWIMASCITVRCMLSSHTQPLACLLDQGGAVDLDNEDGLKYNWTTLCDDKHMHMYIGAGKSFQSRVPNKHHLLLTNLILFPFGVCHWSISSASYNEQCAVALCKVNVSFILYCENQWGGILLYQLHIAIKNIEIHTLNLRKTKPQKYSRW